MLMKATFLGVAGVFLLSFSGCSNVPTIDRFFNNPPQTVDTGSRYGSYLAGRFAGSVRDMRSAAAFYERALDHDPENRVILERAFLLEIADGQFRKAAKLAERIVEKDDKNRLARLVLGLRAFRQGAYAQAREHLEKARNGPINTLVRNLVTAWSYAAEGQFDTALSVLDEASKTTSLPNVYAINRAFLNDFGGRNEEAIADYIEALRLSNGRTLIIVQGYGSLLERQGRAKEAARLYADYLLQSADDKVIGAELRRMDSGKLPEPIITSANRGVANALFGPAAYLVGERAIDLPIIYLQAALYIDPDFVAARILSADLFEVSRRWEDAIAMFEYIPRASVYYSGARIQTAINFDRLDRTDEAIDIFEQLIRRDPNNYDAMITMGDMLRMRSRFPEAIDAYDDALAIAGPLEPEHWSLYYARGVALEQSNRWQEAEQDFLKSLEISPNQPLTLNYLGYSWIDQGVKYDEAMHLINQAVELSPGDGFIVDSLGWGYYKIGDYENAVIQLERAVEMQPDDPTINDHLGDGYWRIGRRIEARFQWRMALSMEPEDDAVAEIERKLEEGLDFSPSREAMSPAIP